MARGTVAIADGVANGATVPTAHTIVTANGALIQAGGRTRKLVLRITNTGGTAGTVTAKAGVNPPAWRNGLGDMAVVVAETTGVAYLLVESARFAQANGDIYLDFSAEIVGTVEALELPAGI